MAAEEAPTEPQEAEDDDPEIDLGEIKVKKSELKAGYMKDADYRRKTAEVAEAKRIAQADRERVHAERNHYANHLDVLIGGLQSQLVGDQRALAQLAETDPAEWVKQNALTQQRYANLQSAIQERQQLANRQSAEQQQEMEEWRKGEAVALQDKLPEWRDAKVKEAESRSIAEYLLEQGYANDELSNLFDHRALLVARDAAKWRSHLAAQKSLKDKQARPEPPKTMKGGTAQDTKPTNSAYQDALAKARKTGNPDDIERALRLKGR